jgi:hypothetical protein
MALTSVTNGPREASEGHESREGLGDGHYATVGSLALCLDCETCFEVGSDPCPACGSRMRASKDGGDDRHCGRSITRGGPDVVQPGSMARHGNAQDARSTRSEWRFAGAPRARPFSRSRPARSVRGPLPAGVERNRIRTGRREQLERHSVRLLRRRERPRVGRGMDGSRICPQPSGHGDPLPTLASG